MLHLETVNYYNDSAALRFQRNQQLRHLADFKHFRQVSAKYRQAKRSSNGVLNLPPRSKSVNESISSDDQIKLDLLKLHRRIVESNKPVHQPSKQQRRRRVIPTTFAKRTLCPEKTFLSILPPSDQMDNGDPSIQRTKSSFDSYDTNRNSRIPSRSLSSMSHCKKPNNLTSSGIKKPVFIERSLGDSFRDFECSSVKVMDYWMPEDNFLDQGLYHKGRKDPSSPLTKAEDVEKFAFHKTVLQKNDSIVQQGSRRSEFYALTHDNGCILAKPLQINDVSTIHIGHNGQPIESHESCVLNKVVDSPVGSSNKVLEAAEEYLEESQPVPLSWETQLSKPCVKTINVGEKDKNKPTETVITSKSLVKFNDCNGGDIVAPNGYSLKLMQTPKSPIKESALKYIRKFSRRLENQFVYSDMSTTEQNDISLENIFDCIESHSQKPSFNVRKHSDIAYPKVAKKQMVPPPVVHLPVQEKIPASSQIFRTKHEVNKLSKNFDLQITNAQNQQETVSEHEQHNNNLQVKAIKKPTTGKLSSSRIESGTSTLRSNSFVSITNLSALHPKQFGKLTLDLQKKRPNSVKSQPLPSSPIRQPASQAGRSTPISLDVEQSLDNNESIKVNSLSNSFYANSAAEEEHSSKII